MNATNLPRPAVAAPEPVGDAQAAADWAGFALRSLTRHRRRALTVFAAVAASTLSATAVMPRTYHVEAKLLAQPNLLMPSLGNPGRAVPTEADSPTKAAAETVMQRENLVKVIRETDALHKWEAHRWLVQRAKDAVMRAVRGPPTDADREDALIGMLEKRLNVSTAERSVTIAVDWPDPKLGYELVSALQRNFLEDRRDTEIASIKETIQILQSHAELERTHVDEALEAYREAQTANGRSSPPVAPTPAPAAEPKHEKGPNPRALAELQGLRSQLEVKRHALASLDEDRQRNLADLQRKLTEARGTYGPSHPVIVSLSQSIGRLEHEPAEVTALRQEVAQLEAAVAERAGELPAARPRAKPEPVKPNVEVVGSLQGLSPPSAAEDLANERLRLVETKYGELLGRIDAARIELDTAEAAFKFRYGVITPPEIPRKPSRPNLPVSVLAELVFAAAVAFVSALARDLRRGRLVEPWQVERALNLPVLAEVELP